jgi:RHS repeat-associated protein
MRRTNRPRVTARGLAAARRRAAVMLGILATATIALQSSGQQAAPSAPSVPRAITVNRTVPRVSPPASTPVFSAEPTEGEIRRARVFAEPLLPLGPTSSGENGALAASITAYAGHGRPQAIEPFTRFLDGHPSSAWRASLLASLGSVYRRSGYYTRALKAWDEAWTLAALDSSTSGRAVGNVALANALETLATLGHVPGLDRWLARAQERPPNGPAAAKTARAREARALIEAHPAMIVPSGPKALEILLHWKSGKRTADYVRPPAPIADYRATAAGTSVSELRTLAAKVDLPMRAARRTADAPLVLPAIVHLGFDHFSAVLEQTDNRFRVRDPALGGEVWMPREALLEEMTGYALFPGAAIPEGWEALTEEEEARIVGHSCPPGVPDPDDCPCPEGGVGMPTYSLHPTQASVLIGDSPLGYSPPRGPSVDLQLRYNHREENQPQTFTFTNLGPKWTMNWVSYVEEIPWLCAGLICSPTHVAVHIPGGGVERYIWPNGNGDYGTHYKSAANLVQISDSPLQFERRHTDGSKEIYSQGDGGAVGFRRVFLTSIVDRHGQALTFTWDAQLRLVALTDAIGQVTTLQYDQPGDPLKVTSVTDPFGRVARMTYTPDGVLNGITDVVNMTSAFESYGLSEFIRTMQTPYGTTSFVERSIAGEYNRTIEATDPLGATEKVEFYWANAPVPASMPAAEVPAIFGNSNQRLNEYVSLHWAKGRTIGDVSQATVTRWMLQSLDWFWDPGWTVNVAHSTQRPGELREWYIHQGQVYTDYLGGSAKVTLASRKLPDGTVYEERATYNFQQNATTTTDPVGRQVTYVYASNGIDLLEVRNTTAGTNDLLASYSNYTAGHQPQTITDAAGQVTQLTYLPSGQLATTTNARQETTSYTYDDNGYLQLVTGPVAGATTSYTYDVFGRTRSVTPVGEGVVTTDYDALNRPTRIDFPDGSYEQFTYDRLDIATVRDRRGRVTRHTYNARRQLVASRDPAGRIVQRLWCDCGKLDALVDANGNITRWERDVAHRVIREVRADGTTDIDYTYDALGRLKTVTDPKQQVTTYTYFADGAVASIAFTNASVATPGVTLTYDPAYARVTAIVDGTGTTTYTYKAPGQLGAGRPASVDGPLANDAVAHTYDELGRIATRAINGAANTVSWTFDTLGRVGSEQSLLGTFTYGYDGFTSRPETVGYPNGQTTSYAYFPAVQDHRLQTIHHRHPNGATLSKFDYTYDAVGNILAWRQQNDATAVLWDYAYDNADQLTRAVKRDDAQPTTILQRFAYAYDPAGNRLAEQIDDAATSWTYDRLNRLETQQVGGGLRVAGQIGEPATVRVQGQPATVDASGQFVGTLPVASGTTAFAVSATDGSGNTAVRNFTVDQAGAAKSFTYDANGNLIGDGTRTFEWDARNQLIAVTIGTHRSEYTYDGQQRRVRVIEKENGVTQSDTRILWCEMVICEERAADGTTVNRRAFRHGEQVGGVSRFFATDHLGSVTDVADSSVTVLGRYAYDPWGRRTVTAGADVTREAFTGHQWRADPSLLLSFYRGYDPELGVWISEDPIGFSEGPNFYRYVAGNPVRFQDPLGLAIHCSVSSLREQLVGGKCPSGAGACTDASMVASATGCRESCGKWSFTGTVDIKYTISYIQPKRSRAADGNSYETHEWLHIGDLQSWCSGLSSKYPSEGFGSASECNAARMRFLSDVRKGFRDARSDSDRKRDK